jgi:hypothetical protein
MIKETLSHIEESIRRIKAEKSKKKELLVLFATLRSEVDVLTRTHKDEAKSIAGFAGVAAHEAARGESSGRLLEISLEGLSSSAKGFELSHPKLVEAVTELCLLLSRMGI